MKFAIIYIIIFAFYFSICWEFFKKEYIKYFLRTFILPAIILIAAGNLVWYVLNGPINTIDIKSTQYVSLLFFLPIFITNILFYFIIKRIKKKEIEEEIKNEELEQLWRKQHPSNIKKRSNTKCWLFIGTLGIIGIAYFVFFHNPKPAEPELNFIETYHKSKDTSSQITEEINIKEPEPDLEELYLRTFDSLSFIDAAEFYCEVRKEYDLADSLFIDSIFPNFAYCSYLEIKEIKNLFQDTPLCDTINKMYISKRTFFIESIENELVNYAYEQATIFSDTIIPIILEEIDEQFAGDFELLINEYKGAIGRIFDSAEDFKREWRRKVNVNNYKALIDNNLYDYKVNLDDFYNSYLGNIGLNGNEYPLPTCQDLNLTIPNAIVNTYINNEQKKTWDNISDFAVDGGLIILEWATAGMATPIVTSVKIAQAGKTVYDIGNTVDELYFDNQAMSDDEKLMVTCADYMNVEVTDFLEEQYYTYLKNKTDSVINQIHNNL